MSRIFFHHLADLLITSSQQANGPITSKHYSFDTKILNHYTDVFLKIGHLPVLPTRFRNQAGDFAVYIIKLRHPPNFFFPFLYELISDKRLGKVINYKWLIRELLHKVNSSFQVMRLNQHIISKLVPLQKRNTPAKFSSQ